MSFTTTRGITAPDMAPVGITAPDMAPVGITAPDMAPVGITAPDMAPVGTTAPGMVVTTVGIIQRMDTGIVDHIGGGSLSTETRERSPSAATSLMKIAQASAAQPGWFICQGQGRWLLNGGERVVSARAEGTW